MEEQTGRDAMQREGALLTQCTHPTLVRVMDIDVHEGRRFVVMEYIKGRNLQQVVSQHHPGPRQAARLVIELCAGRRLSARSRDRPPGHQAPECAD